MKFELISRRNFIAGGTAMLTTQLAAALPSPPALTAGEVMQRIQSHVGMPWLSSTMPTTVDKLVSGDDSTPVRGIVTTTMATLDVLQKTVAAGANMIVSHETPYYSQPDKYDDLKNDANLTGKLEYIRSHGIAIMRLHDHWHHRTPDSIAAGMVSEMGWQKYVDPQEPRQFRFPGTPLKTFALEAANRLHVTTARVVGDPEMLVRNVVAYWGNVTREKGIATLARPDVDTLISGETHEWEVVEYIEDQLTAGRRKALILLGHVATEQGGMRYCAEWLRGFVPEVPVRFIPALNPFWSPYPRSC
ncbi:Nif3-like dinuclear metal center hexameric protein [Paracidobacterium acidisoli]|nr:Nif3-like dinuclear metal center hexameric protein [Paracidobacterium acidisoli]MBT9333370.1 Nif3-like dinuclear metal center hexameric protein [Paracidobacterium acidisoli]